jgi:hypothetical protein
LINHLLRAQDDYDDADDDYIGDGDGVAAR